MDPLVIQFSWPLGLLFTRSHRTVAHKQFFKRLSSPPAPPPPLPTRAQCPAPSFPLKEVYLQTLKSCCQSLWLPISLHLLLTETFNFGILTGLSTLSMTGSQKEQRKWFGQSESFEIECNLVLRRTSTNTTHFP